MKRIAVVLTSCLALSALVTPALAQQRGPRGERGHSVDQEFFFAGGGEGSFERGPRPSRPPMPPVPPMGDGEGFQMHFRGGEGGGPGMPPMGPLMEKLVRFWEDEKLVEELGLTEEQIARLEENFTTTQQALDETSGTLKTAHDSLRDAMNVDSPDVDQVYDAIDDVTEAMNEKMRIIAGHRVVVKNILTEEQEQILHDSRRNRFKKFGEDMRGRADDFRFSIHELLSDGSLSKEDWATIDERLAPLPQEIQDRINERIKEIEERIESGEFTPPVPPGEPKGRGEFRGRR